MRKHAAVNRLAWPEEEGEDIMHGFFSDQNNHPNQSPLRERTKGTQLPKIAGSMIRHRIKFGALPPWSDPGRGKAEVSQSVSG